MDLNLHNSHQGIPEAGEFSEAMGGFLVIKNPPKRVIGCDGAV